MTNQTSSSKTDASGKLDEPIKAVCDCGKEWKTLTMRKLKNKWPICSCKQSMRVVSDAISSVQAAD